jgi:hypothetical protein
MNDAIECRAALCGIRRHAHIEQHDNRRTFVFGDVSGACVFDDIGEHEIYIGRSQDMPDIVVRPDFPVIRDISVDGSEPVKKLAHVNRDSLFRCHRSRSESWSRPSCRLRRCRRNVLKVCRTATGAGPIRSQNTGRSV